MASPCLFRTILAASAVAWVGLAGLSFGQASRQPRPADGPSTPDAEKSAGTADPQTETSLWDLQPRTPPRATPEVEVDPELIYLPDENGRPTRLLGWRMADFLRAWRWMQAGRSRPPADWELVSLRLRGEERDGRAEFAAQLEVRVHGQGWRAVPIDLREAILLTEPDQIEFSGAKEQRFSVAPDSGGYLWHVRADGESICTLRFRFAVVLTRVGREQRCALHLPPAATSRLELVCNGQAAAATTVTGAFLGPIETTPNGVSRLTVEGARGDFWLAWQAPAEAGMNSANFEAESKIHVVVDGASAELDLDLQVRSFGGPLVAFDFRAPTAWRLRETSAVGQLGLTPLPDAGGTSPGWRVTPSAGDLSRVRIPLQFSVPLEGLQDKRSLELEGLEVVGAVRHTGLLSVEILDDSRVQWETLEGTHRIPVPAAGIPAGKPANYAFEIYRQPFRIQGELSRPAAQISVEPRYDIEVDALGARLTADLRISPQSGRLATFELDRQGWTIDRLDPAEVAAFATEELGSDEPLRAELRMPVGGVLELRLRAHRNWAEAPNLLSFNLPCVRSSSQSPAQVAVRPAENVLLAPVGGKTEAFFREPPVAAERSPALHFRGDATRGRLAFDLQILPRRVTVRSRLQAQLGTERAALEQELDYRVEFEPLDMIELELPTALWSASALSVTLAGEELSGTADAARAPESVLQKVRYRLPRAQLGPFQIRLRSTVDLAAPRDAKGRAAWTLPLAAPLDGRLESGAAIIRSTAAGDLSPGPGPWKVAALANAAPSDDLLLETAERVTGLLLLQSAAADTGETVVERVWIQSWYLAAVRQERVVLRVRTQARQFECRLPPEAEAAGLTASLRSGEGSVATDLNAAALMRADNRVVVPLPRGAAGDDRHVIELRYPCLETAKDQGRTLQPPQVSPGAWVQQVCWQLLLPPDEHVVSRPPGYSHEFEWGWRRLYWGRQPTVDQRQLEAWSGVEQSGFEPRDSSQYVFSAQGELRPLELSTVRRSTLVLALSLVGFAAVVAVWRIPARHRAAAVSVATAAVALFALWRPEAAALGFQAAFLGLLLGGLSMWLERRWAARRPSLLPAPPSSWALQRGSSLNRAAAAPSMASTSSAPSLAMPDDQAQGGPA